MIFGRKQRSIDDNNLFHPLTYEGTVDIESIEDPFERFATGQQINEFGQTPRQLFRYDHPQKFSTKPIIKSLFIAPNDVMKRAQLPNRISVYGEEVNDSSEEEEKKLNIDSDSDNAEENKGSYLSDSKSHGIKSSSSLKNLKSKDLEYKKPVSFVQDDEPASSFLKDLNFQACENLGKVHNNEIIELNAIIDRDGVTQLMIVSKDGLIKLYREEKKNNEAKDNYVQKRSFFVSERGISCSSVLNSQESVVIGTADSNIILFNFLTGTEIANFHAHDNEISCISVIGHNLITFSYDTTIKIWNMMNSDFSNPRVLYDHEEAIINADICEKSIISIDSSGIILIRNIKSPADVESRIEVNLQGEEELETAIIKFNKADSDTFFLVTLDSFYVYQKSGTIINEISIDDELEIDFVYQHKDCILVALETGSIT